MVESMRVILSTRRLLCAILVSLVTYAPMATANNAVILIYHHVSSDTPPSTSIDPEQFEQHLAYLAEHHTVLPLTTVVEALQQRTALPANAVAITFDDGYQNILINGHPLLQRYQFPYTVFINPAIIGSRNDQLSWEDVQMMAEQGVSFANHTQHHNHLLQRLADESDSDWLDRTMQDIDDAQAELERYVPNSPRYVAYPYGEFNAALKQALKAHNFVGFGQHSGAAGVTSDTGALPRFPAAGTYANLKTLKTKLNSISMPIELNSFDPMQPLESTPTVTLALSEQRPTSAQVTCFFKNQPLELVRGKSSFSFTLPEALPNGRSRVNCTAPSDEPGRFYWYSQPFFVADENGHYPD